MESIKPHIRSVNFVMLALALLIFFVTFNQDLRELYGWHKFSYFFHLIITGFCLAGAVALNWWEKERFDFKWSQFHLLSVMIFVVGALLRLSYVDDLSVWLDEYVQIANKLSPFVESAKQQQPPFIYQLTTGIVESFGHTERWLRSTSVFFGSITILLAATLGRILQFRFSIQAFWLLAIALNPILIRYSFEGRPNIAGVFFCTLWLCTLAIALKSKTNSKSDFFRILIATYFFCSTIGMQSLALPIYSIFLFLIISYRDKKARLSNFTILPQVLALIFFVPVLIGIVVESVPQAQFHSVEQWTDRIFKFSELGWIKEGKNIFEMIPQYEIYLILMAFSIAFRYIKERSKKENFKNHLIFFALLLLPFIYTWIFQITINWDFYVRYFICYVLIFYLFVGYFLNLAFVTFSPNKEKLKKNVVTGVSFIILIGSSYYLKSYGSISSLHNYGSDVRQVFNKIVEIKSKRSHISMFTVDINASWEPRSIISHEFYLKNYDLEGLHFRKFGQKPIAGGDQIQKMVKEVFENNYNDVFLLMGPFQHFNKQNFFMPTATGRIEVFHFEDYNLLRIAPGEKPLSEILTSYFQEWESENKNPSYEFKLKEVQFYLFFYKGDRDAAEPYYRWIKDQDPRDNILIMKKQQLMDSIWNLTE